MRRSTIRRLAISFGMKLKIQACGAYSTTEAVGEAWKLGKYFLDDQWLFKRAVLAYGFGTTQTPGRL